LTRVVVLWAMALFIVFFGVLTVRATSEQGFGVFSLLSLFILILLAVGVIGALRNPPRG